MIADLGCGDGKLAESLPKNTVHSFDLVAKKPFVVACNFAKVTFELSKYFLTSVHYNCDMNLIVLTIFFPGLSNPLEL